MTQPVHIGEHEALELMLCEESYRGLSAEELREVHRIVGANTAKLAKLARSARHTTNRSYEVL